MPRKLKRSEIAAVKLALLERQGFKCCLCHTPLGPKLGPDVVLDHDHQFGFVRGVLCRNCNGIEGRIRNLANRAKRDRTIPEWLARLVQYYAAFDPALWYGKLDTHPTFDPTKPKKPPKRAWPRKR